MIPLASPLIKAVKSNDLEALKKAVLDHSINGVDARHQTLIFYAIKSKSVDVIPFLFAEKLDVNHVNDYGETPLHVAARLGDEIGIRLLIDAGGDVRMSNQLRQTPLMLSALKGSKESVSLLLDAGAALTPVDSMGEGALFYALRGRKLSILERFIEKGSFVHALNDQGHSLIHEAAQIGDVRLLERLIMAEVNPFLLNVHRQSALHLATFKRHHEMIDALLKLGLEPDIKDHFGQSPERYASQIMDLDATHQFEALKLATSWVSYRLSYPLHQAIRTESYDQALVYIKKGQFEPLYDTYGKTPLFYAMMHQDAYMVDALIRNAHPLDGFSKTGPSLVLTALIGHQLSMLEVLKSHGLFQSLSEEERQYITLHPSLEKFIR
jgi:ankyrin repeat protein